MLLALAPETSVSTNSTTWAQVDHYHSSRQIRQCRAFAHCAFWQNVLFIQKNSELEWGRALFRLEPVTGKAQTGS